MADDGHNGSVEAAETVEQMEAVAPVEAGDHAVTLELSLSEAAALRAWLLKPAADGSAAIDDGALKPVMVKLGSLLDYVEGVSAVRQELEQAGFQTEGMSDDQVAELGRRISSTTLRRASAHP